MSPSHERTARRALEENLWSLWRRFGLGEGCTLHEEADATWFDTPIPRLPYNAVIRFVPGEDADARIDAIFGHYRRRGVPFAWIVHPSARPGDLRERLIARGLSEVDMIPGMWMSVGDIPEPGAFPDGIEVREVRNASDVTAVLDLVAWRWDAGLERSRLDVFAESFGIGKPGAAVRCWIAWRGRVPLSKVVLNLDAGAAGLYGVATKPEGRGLGLARNLTLEAFRAARADGYEIAVLHSSAMAKNLYETVGFRAISTFRVMAPSGFHV